MRLSGFDLNQLICLEALLSERNVTRAADRVHLSQSAMSTILGQLRTHFADALLVRSGRVMVLTPFARSLIAPLSDLMSRAHSFAALAPGEAPADIERELKIAASDYSMGTFLAEAIHQFSERMPNVRLDILPLTPRVSVMLDAGEVDLVLSGQALNVGRTPNERLFEDHFTCLTCREHAPESGHLSQEEFTQRRHVVVRYFENQMAFEDEEILRRATIQRERHVSVWSYTLVPELICNTPMIATVMKRIGVKLAERWPVAIVPFPFAHAPVNVFAYWHPSRDSDPVLAQLLGCIRSTLAD